MANPRKAERDGGSATCREPPRRPAVPAAAEGFGHPVQNAVTQNGVKSCLLSLMKGGLGQAYGVTYGVRSCNPAPPD